MTRPKPPSVKRKTIFCLKKKLYLLKFSRRCQCVAKSEKHFILVEKHTLQHEKLWFFFFFQTSHDTITDYCYNLTILTTARSKASFDRYLSRWTKHIQVRSRSYRIESRSQQKIQQMSSAGAWRTPCQGLQGETSTGFDVFNGWQIAGSASLQVNEEVKYVFPMNDEQSCIVGKSMIAGVNDLRR